MVSAPGYDGRRAGQLIRSGVCAPAGRPPCRSVALVNVTAAGDSARRVRRTTRRHRRTDRPQLAKAWHLLPEALPKTSATMTDALAKARPRLTRPIASIHPEGRLVVVVLRRAPFGTDVDVM